MLTLLLGEFPIAMDGEFPKEDRFREAEGNVFPEKLVHTEKAVFDENDG